MAFEDRVSCGAKRRQRHVPTEGREGGKKEEGRNRNSGVNLTLEDNRKVKTGFFLELGIQL